MPKARHPLHDDITPVAAKNKEINLLHQLRYRDQKAQFLNSIDGKRNWIKEVVARHLDLKSSHTCHVAGMENWVHGSFDVSIPITIENWQKQGVLLRLPLPYRVGEAFRPGNGDEKIRCEAGTYAWLQENAPDVPIPKLYGFAMSTGETFTHVEYLPPLASHSLINDVDSIDGGSTGYMLIEYIEDIESKKLSSTWFEKHENDKLRCNFFRGLSRKLLTITQTRLPRIGSFIIDNYGYLQLTNRPLTLEIEKLENQEIPTNMSRDYTYSTVNSYIMDILLSHDNRLRYEPNAVTDTGDYLYQASALTAMRSVLPSFFQSDLCRGPFVFNLTDLHPRNILVDDNWNITSLIGLEWACSHPIEMLRTPTWLTGKAIDEITEDSDEYDTRRKEFIDILAEEEERMHTDNSPKESLSNILRQTWETGTFWYTLALTDPKSLFTVFYKKIQPRFLKNCPEQDAFQQVMPWYWAQDFVAVAANKVSDRKKYDLRLREAYRADLED
ncbi:hypothetical protein FQN54_004000 [Arachnomyces sp. PD_36]|nr:hypothetical protein FQN54_004000 [Arachnomyces sp. PD_36]